MSNYVSYDKKLEIDKGILDKKFDILESAYETQPIFKMGYTYYTKQVREKLNNNDLSKRSIFLITNNFEENIPDYDEDLNKLIPKSLSFEKDDSVISRDFYKLWEIIKKYNLLSGKSVKTVCLCENGGFLQCIYYFRNKFYSNKKDSYFYNGFTNKEINEYLKNKFKDIKLSRQNSGPLETFDSSGYLSNYENIEKIIQKNKIAKIDFITANGTLKYDNIEFKENKFITLLLGIIIFVLKTQSNKGDFVLRFEDCFTYKTIKLFSILNECYEECFIFKPLFSRPYSNEKYLICKNFSLPSTKIDKLIKNLVDTLKKMKETEGKNLHVNNIISEFEISNNTMNLFSEINKNLINQEHLNINKLIEYLNNRNYFGEQYHNYKNMQIEANKWWFEKFIK